jgi:hypothetical protein
MNTYDEERLAELLRSLPAPPEGWVRAAQELPSARRSLDTIVERAVADAEYRRNVIADLERALQAEGIEPDPAVVALLRERLEA